MINGRHANHNHVDNIWQFTLEDPKITLHGDVLDSKMIQIVTIDAELNPYVDKKEDPKGTSKYNSRKRKRK